MALISIFSMEQQAALLWLRQLSNYFWLQINGILRRSVQLCGAMEYANRDEAVRCLEYAKSALLSRDISKARRLAEKSLHLCPTQECREFLDRLATSSSGPEDNNTSDVPRRGAEDKERKGVPNTTRAEEYTSEQEEAVKRILRQHDYYDILGVPRDVDEAGLKRQYRKLALQFHPDKNRAPKADEAFKAISNAYIILNDPEKRRQYDQFGEDGLRRRASRSSHGFEANFDPDELFRSFFGDNFMFGGNSPFVYTYHRPHSQHHYVFRNFHHHRGHRHGPEEPSRAWLSICQMLPIFLLLFISLFSNVLFSAFSPAPPFALYKSREYRIERFTKEHHIRYFVQESFSAEYPTQQLVAAVEKVVREEYMWELQVQCKKDQMGSSLAGGEKAKDFKSCKQLQKLLKSR